MVNSPTTPDRVSRAEALGESDERFHQLADHITDAFWIRSPDMHEVQYVSPAFERIWGRPVEELYAHPEQWNTFILPEDRERVERAFATLTTGESGVDLDYRIVRPDGEIRSVHVRGFQVRDAAGALIRHVGIVTDITERKRLESQLFQSQKLETVGKLAGGVAHEFNSILTTIIGQSDLLLLELPAGSPMFQSATVISQAATRAATLTRQLLAYGRKQMLRPERLDLNAVLVRMDAAVRHVMGRGTEVRLIPADGLHAVKADAGQVEQVIMNMAMNACDAMPRGGTLTLSTADVTLDPEYVSRVPELKAGAYVMLAIADTGAGMGPAVTSHLFEPFFTTKGVGQGTGLGLSTCYGIVRQSGGHISVESEPGQGTTFRIYLPRAEPQAEAATQPLGAPELPRGTETILLIESDPALREIAAVLLRRLGYTVLAAADSLEARALAEEPGAGHVDLVFSEGVKPLSPSALARRLRTVLDQPRT